jgi:uncharacterized protein YggU (UPF0235/DUF167 family)
MALPDDYAFGQAGGDMGRLFGRSWWVDPIGSHKPIRLMESGARFDIRLTPRGGADRIDGVGPNGELLARVAAAPVEGAANRALLRLIADELGVPASAVVLMSGDRGRHKRVLISGVTPETIRARWPGIKSA